MPPLELRITGKADGAISAANEVIRAHEKIIAQTKVAGGETSALEAKVAALRTEAAKQWTAEYARGLQQVIATEQAAGRSTAELQGRLEALQTANRPSQATSDTGADPVANLDRTTKATAALGDATKKTGEDLRGFGRLAAAGTQIVGGLREAASGGIGSLVGLGRAGRGVIQLLTAGFGPGGTIAIAVATIGAVFLALKDKILAPAQSAEELRKKIKEAADEARALNETKISGITDSLADADRALDTRIGKLQLELELRQRLLAAETGLQIAQIKANTPPGVAQDRAIESLQLNQKLAEAKNPVERAQIEVTAAAERVLNAANAAARLRGEYVTELQITVQDQERAANAVKEIEQLRRTAGTGSTFVPGSPMTATEFQASGIGNRIQQLERDLSPEAEAERKGRLEAAAKLEEEYFSAQKRVTELKQAEAGAAEKLSVIQANADQLGNVIKGTADAEASLARRKDALDAQQIGVRLANQAAGRRARVAGEDAADDPRLNEAQRSRVGDVVSAAKEVEKAGSTENLLKLKTAAIELEKTLSERSNELTQVIEQINAAGRASQKFDEAAKARALEQDLQRARFSPDPLRKVDAAPTPSSGPGKITVGGQPFTPPAPANTEPSSPRPDTPLAPELPAGTIIIDGKKIGDDIGTAAAAAINAQLDDIPGRASGGPIDPDKPYRVHKDEIIVSAKPGTVIPANAAKALKTPQSDATPQATPTPQAAPTRTFAPSNVNPAGHTIAPSNSNPPDEQAPDGIIRSNAQAQARTKEQSAAFHADPANAPKGPTPPTPANPPKSGMSNAEWKQFARSNPEAAQRKIDAAQSGVDPSSNEAVAARDAASDANGKASNAPPPTVPAPTPPDPIAANVQALSSAIAGIGPSVAAAVQQGVAEALKANDGNARVIAAIQSLSGQTGNVATSVQSLISEMGRERGRDNSIRAIGDMERERTNRLLSDIRDKATREAYHVA